MMLVKYRDLRLQNVSPSTVRREMSVLRHCIEIARKEWGLPIPRNPFLDVKLPSQSEGRDRRLNKGEWEILLNASENSNDWFLRPIIELAVETGMRRGELLGLTWTKVNLEDRIAYLPMTKNGRPRKVPLTPRAAEIFGSLNRTNEQIFSINPNSLRWAWKQLLERCQIKDLRLHDLRHEAISRFFERGLTLPEVALISGHRSYSMLFRYTHMRAEDVALKLAIRQGMKNCIALKH